MEYAVRELARWLAVPSVSADPAQANHVRSAARVLARALTAAGGRVRLVPAPGGADVVVGVVGTGRPVVLVYGHHDVVAAGRWREAFTPTVRAGRLVGRGAVDDKGQLWAWVTALRARLPRGTVVLVSEGAEEIGSPGLATVLGGLARQVSPDVVVVCDTEAAPDGTPTLTVSQRGHATLDVTVDRGGRPVHPGREGGRVADPSVALGAVLLDLVANAPHGPSVATDPGLSVVRLAAGEGAAAVPVLATARLDLRFPPGTDARRASARLARAAEAGAPRGVTVRTVVAGASDGWAGRPHHPAAVVLDRLCRHEFGRRMPRVRSGGSLPAARLLADAFGCTPLLVGLGSPGGAAHGPGESLDLALWRRHVDLLTRWLAAPVGTPTGRSRRTPLGRTGHPARVSLVPCGRKLSQER